MIDLKLSSDNFSRRVNFPDCVFDGYLEEVFIYLFLVILPLNFLDAFFVYFIYLFLVLSLFFTRGFFSLLHPKAVNVTQFLKSA